VPLVHLLEPPQAPLVGLRSESRNHDDSKHSEVAPPRPAFLFDLSQSDKRHAARASNKAAPRTTWPTCTSTHDPVRLAYRTEQLDFEILADLATKAEFGHVRASRIEGRCG